jgi:phosphotransferase system enzyme I (PtsI)
MQAVERHGLPAAPGVAAGPLVLIDQVIGARRATGNPARERDDLRLAIDAAMARLRDLAERNAGTAAADMLEFQLAMLEDDALLAPVEEKIAGGADASAAWAEVIGFQITDYMGAEDEYFRARAADLQDLRDAVQACLAGEAARTIPDGAVLTGHDITPSRFLSVDWSKGGGIALFSGSPSSHVAMLARSRAVPMIVGLGSFDVSGHAEAIVDGGAGRIVLSPRTDDWSAYRAARSQAAEMKSREGAAARKPAVTADGVAVKVMINIAGPEDLDGLDPEICDGIGLVRTELLFDRGDALPDEAAQYAAYRRIAEWANGRPVVLRTLDAGGDKPVRGLTIDGESNPFLGTRGIRLMLARPEIFRVQLRAMARAAAVGNVRIMLPMVTIPGEIDRAAALLDSVVAELKTEGTPAVRPPLGIMVEVPAVAIVPELYKRADFFSIGSNDLTQYVTASARDTSSVAALGDPGHPAVLSLIANVVAEGRRLGRDVSLCGDMGGDVAHLRSLIARGLRTASVAPSLVGRVKAALVSIRAGDGT